ncbi:hypothetical protein ACFQH3_03785 [Haladaptatus sp. GCM10025707]|uniref:hypothetical protein n=1 Tax=unclassified Haladaptatus TaxID=2622732 RepID=UPI00360A1FCE
MALFEILAYLAIGVGVMIAIGSVTFIGPSQLSVLRENWRFRLREVSPTLAYLPVSSR